MEKNPFLEEEEENTYKVHKPSQEVELTEAQKARNLKGIDMVRKNLKKVKPFRFRG